MKKYILTTLIAMVGTLAFAETIPQVPTKYFNDLAGLISTEQADAFNAKLIQFERDTSNQFVVYIAPYMDTDSDAFDYTQRIAQSWHVGQKDKNNGLVLFVFMKTASGHGRIQAQVGYGLEGAIPDATAKQITDGMASYFKRKDLVGGLTNGIDSFMSASKGGGVAGRDWKGTGKVVSETSMDVNGWMIFWIFFWIFLIGGIIIIISVMVHFHNKRLEREEEEQQRRLESIRRMNRTTPVPVPIKSVKRSRSKPQPTKREKEDNSDVTPIIVAAAAASLLSSRNDDDDSPSRSSSSEESSSFSMPDFGGGGGGFGGGGAGSDF